MSAIKSIFNNAIDSVSQGFQQNPIGFISDTVGSFTTLGGWGSNTNPPTGSVKGSGTVSIPTGNGDVVVSYGSTPSGFGIDTSNPLVIGLGVLIVGKLLKIF